MKRFSVISLSILMTLVISACDSGTQEQTLDTGLLDTVENDAGDEGTPDTGADVGDLVLTDAGDDVGQPDAYCPSEMPVDEIDTARTKFALTMFHWNIQYVAGGLVTTWNGDDISICEMMFGELDPADDPCTGWDDARLNDWIIEDSMLPVLEMYLKHPDWKVTFEIPGLMLDEMVARHPETLAKLRAAAQSGQVEIVSFHWSDQLFLAFPERDLAKSVELTKQKFAEQCIPLSKVVFNQEGQSGLGKHAFMAKHGYEIDVIHRNLVKYVQNTEQPGWPYYTSNGIGTSDPVYAVVGGSVDPESGVDVAWAFFDDGEVLATPANPYFAPVDGYHPEEVDAYEFKLNELATAGYWHTTITEYVNHLKAKEIDPKPLAAIGDSTWQPKDTEGISRWMGRRGTLPYSTHEQDGVMRAANYRASKAVEGARLMIEAGRNAGKDVTAAEAKLEEAYLHLLRCEVSDVTGINPWQGEFVYGQMHTDGANELADEINVMMFEALGWPAVKIDIGEGKAEMLQSIPILDAPQTTEAPLADIVVDTPGRTNTVVWYDLGGVAEMHLAFSQSEDTVGDDIDKRRVTLTFPRFEDKLIYSPGLIEDAVVEQSMTDFTFQYPQTYLPLANGLVGLGNDWWVLKDCGNQHVAVRIAVTEEDKVIQFIDETVAHDTPGTWVFRVFQGTAEEAITKARALNTHPVTYLEGPDSM